MQDASSQPRGSYLTRLLATTGLLLLLVAGFNALVDPYGLYNLVSIEGFNRQKTESKNNDRMHKARMVSLTRPDAIVISSSRGFALYPDHPGWRDDVENPYNLSVAGTDILEIEQHVAYANRLRPLKQVVIGLGFHMFIPSRLQRHAVIAPRLGPGSDGHWLYSQDLLGSLLSVTALQASVKTIFRQREADARDVILAGGQLSLDGSERYVRELSTRGAFQVVEEAFMKNVWVLPEAERMFSIGPDGHTSLDPLRNLVTLARRDSIDLRLFISPLHARLLETIRARGLWSKYEEWKRQLVAILAEDARAHPGEAPIPLWDFGGYNSISVEPLPPAGDHESLMDWYLEASHYNKRTGDLILDRVLGHTEPGRSVPPDFGVRLDPTNLEAHLEKIREAGRRYRETHPTDVAEVWERAADSRS